jgi:ribonucleoside-triphosphate reductase (thioredoxin)
MTLLSDIVVSRTYAKVKSDGFKENWNEICDRYQQELIDKYAFLEQAIIDAVLLVRNQLVMPSMRMLQFSMSGIKRENMRAYNCSYLSIQSFKDIADLLYISMSGTGVGYSVKKFDICNLPVIKLYKENKILVFDSKEGWCQSVIRLLENPLTTFDYSVIRKEGEALSTGGTASGPEPLKIAHDYIREILLNAVNRQLTSIEVHRIITHLADCVVVGGVRRSACIVFMDKDDEEMLDAKTGEWWVKNSNFARANNSVQLNRQTTTQEQFNFVMDKCFESGAGEPAVSWTNIENGWGFNPCHEIALRSHGTCNLTEINLAKCATEEDFQKAAWTATFLGTLQAGFTDFNYISPKWKQTVTEDALLGVGITGIAHNWELMKTMIDNGNLKKLAKHLIETNKIVAATIGINPAKRTTTIKPSGSVSCVLDTTSGIHAAHSPCYLRRIRVDKTDPVGVYLASVLENTSFLESDVFNAKNWVVAVPYAMENAIYRKDETALQQLERTALVYDNWVKPGHVSGENTHNVSMTCSFLDSEKEDIKTWMWDNKTRYAGISLLPMDNHTYVQAPFEEITKEKYDVLQAELEKYMDKLDLSVIKYNQMDDTRIGEVACGANGCEIK